MHAFKKWEFMFSCWLLSYEQQQNNHLLIIGDIVFVRFNYYDCLQLFMVGFSAVNIVSSISDMISTPLLIIGIAVK